MLLMTMTVQSIQLKGTYINYKGKIDKSISHPFRDALGNCALALRKGEAELLFRGVQGGF